MPALIKSLTAAAAACALIGALPAQAASDCAALRGCAAKFCHIENDIAAAQAQNNSRREAGLLGEAATAPKGPSRKAREDALLDVVRALAVMRTGDETLRDKNKRELRRVLGDDGYAEVERRARATLE